MTGKRRRKTEAEKQFAVQVGRRIEATRKRRCMTQRQLARVINVTQQQLYAYEVGLASCSLFHLRLIALAARVELSELVPNTRYCC